MLKYRTGLLLVLILVTVSLFIAQTAFCQPATDEDWALTVTVTGETGTAPNEFSVNIGGAGSQNFLPAPPPPPQYLTWTEVYEPDWASGPYAEMIYQWPVTEETVWLMTVDPNGNVMPPISRTSVVSWDIAGLPAGGDFSIVEYFSGTVIVDDMRAESSFNAAGTENQYYNIVYVPGAGGEPHFDLAPTPVNFGAVVEGNVTAPTAFSLVNDGTAEGSGTITLDNLTDFGTDLTLPYDFTLPSGESLQFDVWFISQFPAGVKTGQIYVDADDPGNDVFADLEGTTIEGGTGGDWALSVTSTGEPGTAPNEFTVVIGGAEAQNFLPAPPPPPQYLTWAEVYEPDWTGGPYAEMIYLWPAAGDLTWLLTVDPNGNVMPPILRTSVVSWNPADLPAGGDFSIAEYFSGNVIVADMRTSSSFEAAGTENQYYNINYTPGGPSFPIENLTITLADDDVILDWADVLGASIYHIYRGDEAYFDITGMTPLDDSTVSGYSDLGAGAAGAYYYIVTWE